MKRIAWSAALALLLAGTAVLAPTAQAAPANDDRENATPIALTNGAATVTGSNHGATLELGEPDKVCGAPIGNSVWWALPVSAQPGTTLKFTIDTFGSGFDTVLAVWTTTVGGVLNRDPVACQDDTQRSPNPKQSELVGLDLSSGTYYIQVSGFRMGDEVAAGSITLNVRQVDIPGAIAGVVQELPPGGTAQPHPDACVEVFATDGTTSIGTATADASGVYTVSPVPPGSYKVKATSCTPGSHEARWYPNAATADGASTVTVHENQTTSGIGFVLPQIVVPANDDQAMAEKIALLSFTDNVDTKAATVEELVPGLAATRSEAVPSCATPQNTVWYQYRPNETRGLTVSVNAGTSPRFEPIVAIYSIDDDTGLDTEVKCATSVRTATTSFQANKGVLYLIQVGGHKAQSGFPPGGPVTVSLS